MSCPRSMASTESAAICLRASGFRPAAACPAREDAAIAPRSPFQPITRLWQFKGLSVKQGPLFEPCPPKAKVTRSDRVGCANKINNLFNREKTLKSETHHGLADGIDALACNRWLSSGEGTLFSAETGSARDIVVTRWRQGLEDLRRVIAQGQDSGRYRRKARIDVAGIGVSLPRLASHTDTLGEPCESGHEVIPGRGVYDPSAALPSRASAEALTPSLRVSPNRTRPFLRDDRVSSPMRPWLRRFEEVRRAHRAGDFVRSACPHNFRTPRTRHVCCRARRGGARACTAPAAARRRWRCSC